MLDATVSDPLTSTHILVVDPDSDTRVRHAMMLRPVSTDIEEAPDGAEALGRALVRPPQLVVSETRLPRIDGYSLCRILRESPRTEGVRVLFVTSTARPSDVARAAASGADELLVKPCAPADLRATAERLLVRSHELRADGDRVRVKAAAQVERSRGLFERSARQKRRMMSHAFNRTSTTTPPNDPPALRCPICAGPLPYVRSHVGGVNPQFAEQWDYFACGECGSSQYRNRTRKLRHVS